MMKLKVLCAIAALASVLALPTEAQAVTLTFDDLQPGTGGIWISNGYGGLDWYNFGVVDGANYNKNSGYTSGYPNGTVSLSNVAFNSAGEPATFSSSSPFTLNSASFTSAWGVPGFTLTATLGGITQYSQHYDVVQATPTFITFGWNNIDSVTLVSDAFWDYRQVVIDNLRINEVPLPAALPLFGSAFAAIAGLGAARRRKA